MDDERPDSRYLCPTPELYASKLRDDGYDVALLPPSPRTSTVLIAPKPSAPFSLMEGQYTTYPPAPNTNPNQSMTEDDATSVSLYSTTSGSHRASLALPLPHPQSFLPYDNTDLSSRPSSSTGFLPPSHYQSQNYPMSKAGSPLAASAQPSIPPAPHPSGSTTSSGSTLQPPSRRASGSSSMVDGDPPHPELIRIPSEETRVLAQAHAQAGPTRNQRGMVVLYRLDEPHHDVEALLPPHRPFGRGKSRDLSGSVMNASVRTRQSFMSIDSRIPLFRSDGGTDKIPGKGLQLVAYAYQPDALLDGEQDDEDDDWLHDPRVSLYATSGTKSKRSEYREDAVSIRGVVNYTTIWLTLVAIIALFVFYPVSTVIRGNDTDELIANNPNINSTGQATAR